MKSQEKEKEKESKLFIKGKRIRIRKRDEKKVAFLYEIQFPGDEKKPDRSYHIPFFAY